jgi:ankyrin repeat protein
VASGKGGTALTPLQYVVKHNFLRDIETQLQANNMDVNAQGQEGSALDLAVRYGRVKALELLLRHQGIDLHCSRTSVRKGCLEDDAEKSECDGAGRFDTMLGDGGERASHCEPLHEALLRDHNEVAKLLLGHERIDVNRLRQRYSSEEPEETALDIAIRKGQRDIVQILLGLGAISARKEVVIRTVRKKEEYGTTQLKIPMVY